ncbi:hypothetical protein [Haloferula sp. BvORR071]|uniref:hypothetical protein n=1 Tax=Haloferula sp. BvORR071 TaxID=1396141 RepID=UPI002240FA9D|nr:hypothetical protein [Haloferula sp. BvORR071]
MNAKFRNSLLLLAALACTIGAGCRQKERVMDVQTPGGSLKVDRDKKTGDVEIKVEDKK